MAGEIETYAERLDALRREVAEAIHDMGADELNWAPTADETNSPAALVAHIAGSESFWVHQVIGGLDINRDRDSEFRTRAADSAGLEDLLLTTGETSGAVLRKASGEDLSRTRTARPGEPPVSLRYAIVHQIEHMSQHLGHLTLTKQLYAARHG